MITKNHLAGFVTAATLALLISTTRDTSSYNAGMKWGWLGLLGLAGIAGLYRPTVRQPVRVPARR